MNSKSKFRCLALVVTTGILAADAQATFIPVDFSSFHNVRLQSIQPNANQFPEGDNLQLGGVPFDIPAGGLNVWSAGPGNTTITVPVGIFGVDKVHTLINTGWGQPGPNSYAAIEFIATGGLMFTYALIGNADIRDHLYGFWTNSINNTSTINVFTSTGGLGSQVRLDKQEFDLPAAFLNETLTSIRFTDTGGEFLQRMIVEGITVDAVQQVPEGSASIILLTLGMASLLGWRWRFPAAASHHRLAR
jgi:hypothetical protein